MDPNSYSARWFEFFHVGISEARTSQEVTLVSRCAPLPDFRNVVDVCCGMGRHARALSKLGYSVTGIDRDADAITKARELGGGPTLVHADIRNYKLEPEAFDVAIVMSQSFGHFDPATNRDLLCRFATGVRQGGRIILDLWNSEFFAAHQGERELETPSGTVRESKRMEGDCLFVRLDYPGGDQDQFEWQLFSPAQMSTLANSVGLSVLLSCRDFDSAKAPASTNPRVQFLLERSDP
jgi:SAM-dependent methyltransferase